MNTSKKISDHNTDHAVAGAVSGFITRLVFQPLDVIKIRFQLQIEPIINHHVSKYHSIKQAFFLITREEGIFALWKGHIPAQLLSVVYGMSQFYSYHLITKATENFSQFNESKYSIKFVAGASAGCIATTISFPFDTMRTRLVAQSSNHAVYKGLLHCCSCIIQHESSKAFFNGLLPTLLQIAPHSGLQFAFYGLFTDIYKRYSKKTDTSFYNSVLSGSVAGLLAKTVIYPLDLSRKRLQIQGFQHGRKGFGTFFSCTGMLDCLRLTLKVEGPRGLFKGLAPSQLKAAVTTALHFTIYEQCLKLINTVRKLHASEKLND
ncbi:mitochondrial thiamine pyrophosphate carrier [Nomia melanderi]|uniref:mitochondrial thiamine pyrophosphate carrier n=1 Tax=Nomia melanderi TaxID=2448451 RepID=UPI0013046164|nr:mitochondrial thiamine pyrophosphate carrier-like [Nomia melanderi]XP_031838500.1 mitochondrial thiamine pyrophosphate carrier-like [Nomia melanderi]XP_031838501.1 mitochondrial thiamine pyrophosphate carrier-like [Nomia melanderi]XP_031838502.1 mitochondrial thiamine pyrophosphate carrier-like [Nomia melanderi]